MARRGSLSDDWELLQTNHDVLSCSDTETSEGGENDSLEASAIIEALEETPATSLGLTLGSLPQFLGGWYGSSPPAAGRTFTVDLSSNTPTSNTVTADELQAANDDAKQVPVSESFEDAEDELPASIISTVSGATSSDVAAAPIKEPTVCKKTTSSSTAGTTEPTAAEATAADDSAPFLLHTVLLVLLSAAGLATMLLLLGAAAGTRANSSTPYSINSSPYITHTFHTTSTEAFKPFSKKINSASFVGGKFPGANRKLYNHVAPAAATAAASGSTDTASGRRELPWWLQYNASSAMRRTTAGVPAKLPALPPNLQSVVDGSIRANMSASQRFRLHLWLMHCAARNNTATQHGGRQQVGVTDNGDVSLAAPFPFFTTPAHARPARPVAYVHECSLPGTARDWRTALNPSDLATGSFQYKRISTSSVSASKGYVAALCFAFQCRRDAANSTNAAVAPAQGETTAPARPVAGARPVAPPPMPAPVAAAPVAPWAFASAPAAPVGAAPAAAAAAGAAAAAAGAAAAAAPAAAAVHQHVVVPPTKPVPPLYRPPLPCLLLGSPRPNTAQHRSAQHSMAQRNTASAPIGRTHNRPNMTLRHHQGFAFRAWAAHSSGKPFGRTLSMGMARWKWYQQSTANSHNGGSGNRLTLPMLPPVCWPAAASKQQQAGRQGVGLTLPMLPPVSDSGVFSSASTADGLSTSAQHQTSHTCVTECAQLCHQPYSCGAVCVERCPGLPHIYISIPASSARGFAGESPGAISMPPAADTLSAQLAAATVAVTGKYRGGAIPLPPVAAAAAPSCAPKSFKVLAGAGVLAVPNCAPAVLANLTQCKKGPAADAAAKCAAASLAALAQCWKTNAGRGDGCTPASLAGLARCKRTMSGRRVGCAPATIAALAQCRQAAAEAPAADCAPASIPALAQCKQPVPGTAAKSAPATIPLLAQCKTVGAGTSTSGCALASLPGLAQCRRTVARAAAHCSPAPLAALAQCNYIAAGARADCAPASLAALAQCKWGVLGLTAGCAPADLAALAQCRRAVAGTVGASTALCVRTPLPVLAPTAGTAPRRATAMCAPTHLAALAPAATVGLMVRTCHDNSTAVNALSASVKLAAAAGNLAAAAADLASAAAKLATAAGTLRSFPLKSITNSPAGRMSAQLHAAPENASTPAPTLPQLMPIVTKGEPSVDAAAGAASSISTRGAGHDVTTGWVASLVTLPMLPPAQDEGDRDTCVDSDLAGSDADASSSADRGDCMYLAPLQPGVSYNVTSNLLDASNGKPGQPFWLNPVM